MMMNSKNQLSELLSAMNFPTAGGTLNGVKVISASANMEQDILKYEVVFPKGTKTKQIPSLLSKFFATQIIPTDENLIVRHHDYTVKPKSGKVAVVGAMHILSVVRANPGAQEFDEDYSKMEMTNPETYFRKHQCGPINSPQFRAKMFTFVSLMGENYGYGLDNCVYHRRASLIMPKIKITKAVPQAKMMYHTHPRKDEPSLSSPDDYLLYMDLSHKPRSIRHFYTVMADRMDYFHITPKKDSKNNYLKLDEDGIIKELDAEMNDIEAKWDKKTPKTGEYQDDLRFCENITRDVVKWLNKKYGKYFIIKYKCYYKVKKNPPVPEIDDLHLKDEVVEIALESIKQRTQGLTPPKQDSHEDYAYWHNLRSLDTLQGSAKTLGISPQGSHKRTHQRYMNKAFEDTQYNYHDVLNILNLAHDIAKEDSKIRDGGELLSRMEEICEYLEISETGTETLQFLEDVIHNENLFTEEAMTMCGDFYGLALLSSYAIQAVGAVGEIKKGTKEYQLIEYEIYTNLKSETQTRFQDFLVGELERSGKAFGENAPIAQGFVDSFLNPPPVISKRADFEHVFPPEVFAYDFDLVKEALDEFNRNKYDPTKPFITLGRIHLRFPVTSGKVSMSIVLRTGKAQIFVTGRPNAMEDAIDAVTKVGTALVRGGLTGIDPEEYDVQAIDVAQNPQTSQVIAIAGPSGAGKSTTIRSLLKLLPNSKTVPTVTTRQKRKSDKPGERVFTSSEKFKKDMKKGNMVAAQLQKNGNYYGRRKSDFEGADYVIIDVNLKGINAIKRAYPNAFTVYLEPVEDPEFIRKRLLRRGDMSPQEARGRASIIPSHIKDSKNMDFDARIQTKQGEFAKIALELEPMIPKQNPSISDIVSSIYSKEEEEEGVSIKATKGSNVNVSGDIISGDVINLQAGSTMIADNLVSGNLTKSNPSKKPKTIRIEESPNKEKKLVAYFYDKDGKKFRTVHFGARGMSDYTQHKNPDRMKSYLARHGGMGENWKDPMTAGALSRWILWGKPSLRESFNDFKKRFKLEGVMAVTNTRMNPSENLTPTPSEIKEALDIFGKQQGLDASNATLIAGAALYMHGLKPVMNDIDAILPGMKGITEGYVNGLELDIGGGPDFTPEMLEYEVKDGVRYQSLPAILAFYRMLNREKDQVWISKLSSMISNPHHCPIEVEARRAASDPSFKHHEWYTEHHLDYVMAIAKAIVNSEEPEDQQLIHDMVWMHDYPKMMGDNDNFELVRELVSKHRSERYTDRLMNQLRWMEEIKSLDWSGRTTTIAAVMSTADALAHYYGPFWQIYMDENKDKDLDFLKKSNAAKLEKDKRKLRAGPMEGALDSVKFQYKGRKVRIVGNDHIKELIEKKNPPILTPWAVFIVGKVGDKYAATTRDDGRIGLPGGKVDAGESGKVAVMREATEEGWSFPKETNLTLIHQQDVEGKPIDWYMADTTPSKLSEYKEKHRGIKPILITEEELRNSGFGNENLPLHRKNPMAPGYQSYGWTTQDWRSIKVNNKGDIDYSEKCGAEGTKTPSGSPRLCLPAAVVKSLIRTESGKEVIRKQARKKARAKKGERVPWHPRIKKIWKRIEDKTVKDKPNPPSFISARDPQKWSDRYDRIIKMSGDELLELAKKQAAEKGLRVELEVYNGDYEKMTKRRRNFPLPPKYEKLYRKFIESKLGVDILLYRGKTLVDELNFGLITESPKELFDYLESRKRWPKTSAFLPYVANVYKSSRDEPATLRFKEFFTVAATQPKNRFPISVGGGGGFGMSEGQQGKGYYGIIKTYQAGFLEANNIEAFGDGITPMRVDMYQSYGWLSAYSYKDNYPYPSRAAEYYLNVAGKSKLANKDADYVSVYRPVYSRKMTGAAYRAGVKKMLDAVTNPPEWRHGEFAEEDPFEEYF